MIQSVLPDALPDKTADLFEDGLSSAKILTLYLTGSVHCSLVRTGALICLGLCDQQTVETKKRAAFQIVLKCRPQFIFRVTIRSEYVSEAHQDVYRKIRQGRNGQGSLPCSTPLQSLAETSPGSPRIRRLPPGPGAGSWNRR